MLHCRLALDRAGYLGIDTTLMTCVTLRLECRRWGLSFWLVFMCSYCVFTSKPRSLLLLAECHRYAQ